MNPGKERQKKKKEDLHVQNQAVSKSSKGKSLQKKQGYEAQITTQKGKKEGVKKSGRLWKTDDQLGQAKRASTIFYDKKKATSGKRGTEERKRAREKKQVEKDDKRYISQGGGV